MGSVVKYLKRAFEAELMVLVGPRWVRAVFEGEEIQLHY